MRVLSATWREAVTLFPCWEAHLHREKRQAAMAKWEGMIEREMKEGEEAKFNSLGSWRVRGLRERGSKCMAEKSSAVRELRDI